MKIWGEDPGNYPNEQRIIDLERIIRQYIQSESFSCLDLCCGTGEIIYLLSQKFPKARYMGVDILAYPAWTTYSSESVSFTQKDYLDYIKACQEHFDIILMLNTLFTCIETESGGITLQWIQTHGTYCIMDDPKSSKSPRGTVVGDARFKSLNYLLINGK